MRFGAACGLGIICGGLYFGIEPELVVNSSEDLDGRRTAMCDIIATLQSYISTSLATENTFSLAILGAVLGIGYALPALDATGDKNVLSNTYKFLLPLIDGADITGTLDPARSNATAGAFISVAPIAVLAFRLGIIGVGEINSLVSRVTTMGREVVLSTHAPPQSVSNLHSAIINGGSLLGMCQQLH